MKLSIFFHQKMYFLNLKVIFFYIFLMTLCPFVINLSFLQKNVSAKISAFLNFHEKVLNFANFDLQCQNSAFSNDFSAFSTQKSGHSATSIFGFPVHLLDALDLGSTERKASHLAISFVLIFFFLTSPNWMFFSLSSLNPLPLVNNSL